MPQPYKFLGVHGGLMIGGEAFDQRPEIASLIGKVAVYWSHLENTLARNFTYLFKDNHDAPFAVYHAVRDRELRNQIFMAAAGTVLPSAMLEEYRRIGLAVKNMSARRNLVVHGIWGTIEQKVDSIFLVEQSSSNAYNVKIMDLGLNLEQAGEIQKDIGLTEYVRADFDSIIEAINHLARWSTLYAMKVLSYVRTGEEYGLVGSKAEYDKAISVAVR